MVKRSQRVAPGEVASTRERILAAARELLARQEYHRTSLQQIADLAGTSKAAVLYHFPTKDWLLADLAEPLLEALEAVLAEVESSTEPDAAWMAVEGFLDAMLANRGALYILLRNPDILLRASFRLHRYLDVLQRAHRIIAGPHAGLEAQVRAVQAVAGLSDPVMFFTNVPVGVLREAILNGTRAMLSGLGDQTGPSAGRKRAGRPRALDAAQIAAARRMYQGGRSVKEIAAEFGVSRATLYRHLTNDSALSQ